MSEIRSPSPTSTPSNFEAIFIASIEKFSKQTKQDLRKHPLASKINACKSAEDILAIFRDQAKEFSDFRTGDPKLIKCLEPIISCLYAVSTSPVLGTALSLVFPPASVIFSGIGVLLSTPKSVKASYDALVEIFECIECFVKRVMIYTEIKEPTPAMTEVLIKIMAELIAVLALVTKQINQRRIKKYVKKFLGENEIETALQRLDRLTGEESKIAVAQTLNVVSVLANKIHVVMEGHEAPNHDIQDKLRNWLSPPDPWSNFNIARSTQHPGTATWFTQGDTLRQWKSTASLLWVNGLPGSGKTIISSSIIEDVQYMCQTGLAILAIFYCDFRDTRKQNARDLLSSLLIQLCDQSYAFIQVLSSIYSTHGDGSRQPSIDTLLECLKSMFKHPDQGSIFLVIDALDECPNSSGCPTPREQILMIVQELINLRLPGVHLCITSRPEVDIRDTLEPIAAHIVLLHEQAGQNRDIVDYINDFVGSDPRMQRWREEDKQIVIETLTNRAGGMFRWVHCQIETLRRCFPPSIRRTLDELPRTIDETYEHTLMEIDDEKKAYASRLFQCLAVSIRPLHVKELAELFAFLPDAESALGFKFNIGWRPEDPEEFVLSACSTLVTVVCYYYNYNDGDNVYENVVQFSHFSVREYLTSDRIGNSAHVSHFHIFPRQAHTLLASACLSVLLQLDYSTDETDIENFPLARYAAENWLDHALFFGDVSSDIRDGLDCLFDRNKPHLAAWIWLYDVENCQRRDQLLLHPTQPDAVPLYYAALCGLRDLAERLLDAYPQDVNGRGGYHETPLHAAVDRGHSDVVLLLLDRGASIESQGSQHQTPLYMASSRGHVEVVRSLLDRGADPNAQCDDYGLLGLNWTPLLVASENGRVEVARVLLEHSADVHYRDNFGTSPLHIALRDESRDLCRLLLDHGANPNATDIWDNTALHVASSNGQIAVVLLLLDYGARMDVQDVLGYNLLHEAASWRGGRPVVMKSLLDHGADTNTQTEDGWTALHWAANLGRLELVEVLLKHGADPQVQTDMGETPFQVASRRNNTQITRLLSERTAKGMLVYDWD